MINNYKIYGAPMQGYTDNVWRNVHHQIFGTIDTYYAPFMCIDHGSIRKRDINDLVSENNSVNLVPQILCCTPEEATTLVNKIKELGYKHININLGCPHPPVAKKHKGSGLLNYPDEMEKLFVALNSIKGISYSVKMRLGWDDANQWKNAIDLLPIINPTHVIMHPRLGIQQYKGELNMKQFDLFTQACPYPILYNGNIMNKNDIDALLNQYQNIQGIMIGRGLVANPHLLATEDIAKLETFHEELIAGYAERLGGGEQQVLLKMKSLWEIFLPQANRKNRKAIKKSHSLEQYMTAACEAINSVIQGEAEL